MIEPILNLENDYFVQVYDHYLAFARDIMKEKKERKQFEIGLLIWYFKYWYSLNLKNLAGDMSHFAKRDIGFIEKYIRPYLLLVEAENNKHLIKKELSKYQINRLPLSKLEEFRKIEKWNRSTDDEIYQLYSVYRLMIHSSYPDIVSGIRNSIQRDSVIKLISRLSESKVITCFHGIHREKNKNSYLYNPKPLNDYLKSNYYSDKFDVSDYWEKQSIEQLQKKGYQVIAPNKNKSPNKKEDKKQKNKSSTIFPESSWDGFLSWAKSNLTNGSLGALSHLIPVRDTGNFIELKGNGDISQFHKQVIVRYFSDTANPKKEVKFI
ncbi:MAG: hypothetical protein KDK36_22085 [Leptospiraceae bacterium]|nr:hypothetical protein [Leptospiraceae bacterium]